MNGYEPYDDGFGAWWWHTDRFNEGMGLGVIPHATFRRSAAGTLMLELGGRCYATREEALQDLAQAMMGAT